MKFVLEKMISVVLAFLLVIPAVLVFSVSADEVIVNQENSTDVYDYSFDNKMKIDDGGSAPELLVGKSNDYTEKIVEAVAEKNPDGKFDLEIEAPEEYKSGDDITVDVKIKNISSGLGIIAVTADFYYDHNKLALLNNIDSDGAIKCISLPEYWENAVKPDRDTNHNVIDNGHISVMAYTAYDKPGNQDGFLTFSFKFKVKEDVNGPIGIYISHESVSAKQYDLMAGSISGNGGYSIISEAPLDQDEQYISNIIENTGETIEKAELELVIEAPKIYIPECEIAVKVSIHNIGVEDGIVSLLADFYYDPEKLQLMNTMDTDGVLECINLPDSWENLVKLDRDQDKNIINNGHITIALITARNKPVKEDGALEFTFRFRVKAAVEGVIGFYIPHASIRARKYNLSAGDILGNGGYALVFAEKEHIYGDYISNGDGTHTHRCTIEGCNASETEDCYGGIATCTKKAVCEVCHKEYGGLAAHSYTEAATAEHLKTAATCTKKAVYYKSCGDCGANGTETFEYGDLDPENHTGGTHLEHEKPSTCTEKGYTGDTYCSGCGEKIADGSEIPTKPHTPGKDWVEEDGKKVKKCTECGTVVDTLKRLPGDVDDDGKITVTDCLYLKRYILGTLSGNINFENADVDGNGRIDAMDYLYLKRGYLGTFDISKFA